MVSVTKENKTIDKDRLLKIIEVVYRVGIKKSKIYDLIKKNEFPKQIKIKKTNMSRWRESEIDKWLEEQYA